MTLPPRKLGDNGQRYEIRAAGYPEDAETTIGWSSELQMAITRARGLTAAPGMKWVRVVDRKNGGRTIWQRKM